MAKTDNIELLSVRLGALHKLITEMRQTLQDWIRDGSAKRFALAHPEESDGVEQEFGSLIIQFGDLGEKLAWLANPHAAPLPVLEEMYEVDSFLDDNPIVNCDDFPETGTRHLDTAMCLVNVMNGIDSAVQDLKADCGRGRFDNDSDYPDEEMARACTGLLVDSIYILDHHYALRPVMVPDAHIDVPGEMSDYLKNRIRIQEHEIEMLRASIPSDEELAARVIAEQEEEEQAKRFFASWHGMQR